MGGRTLLESAIRAAAAAQALVEGLKGLSYPEREQWLRGEDAVGHPGLGLALVVEAVRGLDEGPEVASGWAALAELVLSTEDFELRAMTAALRGNAERTRGDLAAARTLFSEAYELLRSFPVADRLNSALVHRLYTSLLIDLRRLDEAEEAVGKAYASYRLYGSAKDRALCQVKLGMISHYRGDYVTSSGFYYLALKEGIDPRSNPRLFLMARLNLTMNLVLLGRVRNAADLLAFDADLYEEIGSEQLDLYRRWVEAQIAEASGLFDHAVGEYEAVFESFRAEGQALRAAQTALHLVRVHLTTGRFAAAKQAAEAAHEVFSFHEVDREALAALAMVAEAARKEALTIETVNTVARGLHVIVYANPPAGAN